MSESAAAGPHQHIYDDSGDDLMQVDRRADRVVLMPSGDPRTVSTTGRIRIQWGQHLLADLLGRRYRTLVCGVNPVDNTHGIVSQLAQLLPTSQWTTTAISHHAQTIAKSAKPNDVFVLKFDLDAVEVFALLRPPGRDHFLLDDLGTGFRRVAEMLAGRHDRQPCASVSFLGAKSNRLIDRTGEEPSFESVLRVMYDAGYRGDVYPAIGMWELAPTGVFASYPFPESLERMRSGGF